MSEYTNSTSNGSSCSYSSLGNYNDNYSMEVPFQGKQTSGVYMVPTFAPITYDSLTNNVPSCNGYANIESAYGQDAANCQTTYRTAVCGNNAPAPQQRRRRF